MECLLEPFTPFAAKVYIPYPGIDPLWKGRSMIQRDDNKYRERVTPVIEENDKNWREASSEPQEGAGLEQDLDSH
ncbi:hypothetical protein C8R21_10580 [Nitrosospira multiformis]|jgi:hypothetical protein|uniref:Uncharacterized protein n=1 Tax=Nitrosospira multiformis TaxID=1231 RepID=A0A2T5IES5_9PROT|nr:hypothetical protein C8R21_10580 [Nitrosospira multiformis]